MVVVVMSVLLGAVIWVAAEQLDRVTGGGVPRDHAWTLCKEEVRSTLSDPDSAEFSLMATDFAKDGHGGWLVSGTFDTQDDSGVESEVPYGCEVDSDGDVSADVSE
jgi:hypothetical protein